MNCKHYDSKENYYGVAGDVAIMTSGVWECEPDDEEIAEYFLKWMDENGEILEPDYPKTANIYCDECEEEFEFSTTPSDVFSNEELWNVNMKKLEEWLKNGIISAEDYLENIEYLKEKLNKKEIK